EGDGRLRPPRRAGEVEAELLFLGEAHELPHVGEGAAGGGGQPVEGGGAGPRGGGGALSPPARRLPRQGAGGGARRGGGGGGGGAGAGGGWRGRGGKATAAAAVGEREGIPAGGTGDSSAERVRASCKAARPLPSLMAWRRVLAARAASPASRWAATADRPHAS